MTLGLYARYTVITSSGPCGTHIRKGPAAQRLVLPQGSDGVCSAEHIQQSGPGRARESEL